MKVAIHLKSFYFPDPISIGRATITYSSPNDFNLSFKSKDKITILSKSATETSDDVWYVEINGKHGYAPKKFILEEKVIVSTSKLITVQNVPTETVPATINTETVQNINESSPEVNQDAEIIKNSSEATVSNESDKETDERSKRSVEIGGNEDAPKEDEVKIEDLNKYDSKNFDENAEDNDEDGEEDEDDEEEYDDAENSIDSEEDEIREPVNEEPVVKKTAYVTTDPKVENSGATGNPDAHPTLEIMAPTQSEIEQLKQQQSQNSTQETNDSTPSAVNSSVNSENDTASSTTSQSDTSASEQQFSTTTVPIDVPQNPLDIQIDTTTPLPGATQNTNAVDATKVEPAKEESAAANLVNGNSETIVKVDSPTTEAPTSEVPLNPTSEEVVLIDQIPPFKPLPPVENVSVDPDESKTDIPNTDPLPVVDQKIDVIKQGRAEPSVIQEPAKITTPLSENDDVTKPETVTVSNVVIEGVPVPTQPTEVVDKLINNLEDSNETLPIEVAEPAIENSIEQPAQEAQLVVDSLDTAALGNDSNNATSTTSGDTVTAEKEIVSPLEILSSTDSIPTADYLTQKVNEGVGVIEPILQPSKMEEQQQVDNNNNLESGQSENEESKEGVFDMLINSVKNLFGGSSTVESLVEDPSNENFDETLNGILFSQAQTSNQNENEGTCLSASIIYQI